MPKLMWNAKAPTTNERLTSTRTEYEAKVGTLSLYVEHVLAIEFNGTEHEERAEWFNFGVDHSEETIECSGCSWTSLAQAQEMAEAIARVIAPDEYAHAVDAHARLLSNPAIR
jgi:hypothetical protein